ncbi:MAG TPA: GNAT family N-acetyltransferase [Acidobacteriota bacterium]|nr:GNAT family N-acetyltransferase [Acidobacteriota bacterium]
MIEELRPEKNIGHFALLKEAYIGLFNDPRNLPMLSFTLRPFSEETLDAWFRAHVEHGVSYYSEMDGAGRISGLALTRTDPVTGFEFLSLVVRRECRRKGIGRRLTEHVIGKARTLEYKAIDVAVYAENVPMLKLVLDEGFIPIRMSHNMRADGADLVHLRKVL